MSKLILLLLFFLAAPSIYCGSTDLTIMTYNIRHGKGGDDRQDFNRVIEVIREVNPDILILNEVDEGIHRSDDVLQASLVASTFSFDYHFFPVEGTTNYGNAVYSKFPITYRSAYLLPQPKWMLATKRGCTEVSVTIGGKAVRIFGAHLGLAGSQEIKTELGEIVRRYKENPGSAIIAGDFNVNPVDLRGAVPDLFTNFFSANDLIDNELLTISSLRPYEQIDYIFLTRDFMILDVFTVETLASDHRPLVAKVRIVE
jgi:endonuclease/exonuclease/phosphatase family metal-dependent hydrolase